MHTHFHSPAGGILHALVIVFILRGHGSLAGVYNARKICEGSDNIRDLMSGIPVYVLDASRHERDNTSKIGWEESCRGRG